MFGTAVIGGDVLDIGSRKIEMGTRRQRSVGASSMGPAPLVLGAPGQFDLPNVEDVCRIFMFGMIVRLKMCSDDTH